MKKKLLLSAILIIALAAVGIWYFVLRDESISADNAKINSSEVSKTIKEQSTPDGDWTISTGDDVFVGYRISEVFGGESISKNAVGKSNELEATLKVSGTTISNAEINVDMTKLESDSSQRDSRMENEGLETNKFGTASFKQTKDLTLDSAVQKNIEQSVMLQGDLTLHGVTKEVTIELKVVWDGKTIKASGTKAIDLPDFEIDAPNSSFVKVEDKGDIKFQLLFIPA